MKLEEAIKQRKFHSEAQKLSLNMLYTYLCLSSKHKEYFDQYDVTQQQYNVLRILRGSHPEPLSTSMIRERMLDKMSDVSRIVDRLIKKGFAESKPCKRDRRLVDVFITSKGLKLLRAMDKTVLELSTPFAQLADEEQQTMNNLLDKIREELK